MKRFSKAVAVCATLLSLAACGGGGQVQTSSGDVVISPSAYRLPEVVNAVPPQN